MNHNIEDLLIKQGVEVNKFVNTGDWAYSQIILRTLGLYNEETAYLKQARPYLNYHIGGMLKISWYRPMVHTSPL